MTQSCHTIEPLHDPKEHIKNLWVEFPFILDETEMKIFQAAHDAILADKSIKRDMIIFYLLLSFTNLQKDDTEILKNYSRTW